jgi:biotin synthase
VIVTKVRASIGTLAAMKLVKMKMLAEPTTAYLLLYSRKGCNANCLFCPQSVSNRCSKDLVSRVPWPIIELEKMIEPLGNKNPFLRICIQSVLKRDFQFELIKIVKSIRDSGLKIPISVGTTPIDISSLKKLKCLGVDHLGVGLDVAVADRFDSLKKPFSFDTFFKFINRSVKVFGSGCVYVHLIYGLGEKDVEFVETMEEIFKKGAAVALFAFTPIHGTRIGALSQPKLESYRLMQIIRFHLSRGYDLKEIVEFDRDKVKLRKNLDKNLFNKVFITSGCPGCNRPFYNERPIKIYNYPSRAFLSRESELVAKQVQEICGEIG